MNKLIIAVILFLNLNYCFSATDGFMVSNDSRVREFYYKDNEIYNIYLSEGKALVIEFELGEEVMPKGIGIGNPGAIDVGKNKNILMVKPKSTNYGTNLIVVTNKRNYVFNVLKPTVKNISLYKVVFNYGHNKKYSDQAGKDSKKRGGFFSRNFNKIKKEANNDSDRFSHIKNSTVYNKNIDDTSNVNQSNPVQKNNLPPAIHIKNPVGVSRSIITPNRVNFKELKPYSVYDYIVKGDMELIPIAIFDNGSSLHMVFKSRKDIPLIYKLDENNRERSVRYKIENDMVIINEIPYVTILKKGRKSLQIKRINKSLSKVSLSNKTKKY